MQLFSQVHANYAELSNATEIRRMSVDIPYGPERKPWGETLSPLAKSQGTILVSPPSKDPATLYDFKQEAITSVWYQVPSNALSEEQRTRALAETAHVIKVSEKDTLGYRRSFREFPFTTTQGRDSILSAHINNAGSPFEASYGCMSTLWMERNVLDYYASLWHAKWPHDPRDPDSYWGYTLTMGSTEGNLHTLWTARDYLSGKYTSGSNIKSKCALSSYHYNQCKCPSDKPNAFSPVVFYSHDAHYSLMKAAAAIAVPSFYEMGTQKYPEECPLGTGTGWLLAVPCVGGDAGPGTIDIDALKTLVDFFSGRGHPIIVIFSYGTTSKGA